MSAHSGRGGENLELIEKRKKIYKYEKPTVCGAPHGDA